MPKVKKMPKVKTEREVVYPELRTVIYQDESLPKKEGQEYAPPLDVDTAKQILGWEIEQEGVKFGDDYHVKDHTGRKVRLTNNTHNREIDENWVRELVQNHLRKQFTLNGEAIIVGKYGSVLSAQHRLVSLILAEQQRDGSIGQGTWDHTWGKSPVTMQTVAVFGVDESPETVRTIDNVKPKSLADVLYADPELWGKATQSDRSQLTKMLETAVRKVRYRTHADKDAYRPKRTHAEEVTFLEIHERIKKAVKHIHEENKPIVEKTKVQTTDKDGNPVEKEEKKTTIPLQLLKINPGSAAGLLYLMATGGEGTDGDSYRHLYQNGDVDKAMKKIKYDRWDSACQFWSLLCDVKTSPPPLQEVRHALNALVNPNGEGGGSSAEREAIIIKAWNAWINDEELTAERLSLETHYSEPDQDGNRFLVKHPDVGGIDFGVPEKEVKVSKAEGGEGEGEQGDNDSGMTEQEVEERKEAERMKKELAAADQVANPRAKTGPKPGKKGQTANA